MFLSRRTAQAEYFDFERPRSELADFYRALDRMNRRFLFTEPFQHFLPHLLGESGVRTLSLLDLGAGNGSLGRTLREWAAKHRWDWRTVNLDSSETALSLGGVGDNIAGLVTALPFRDASFDVSVASQMTHHLTEAEAVLHLSEAWRVARKAVFISDLHRNPALYALLWFSVLGSSLPKTFRQDALLSVKRGWRLGELKHLALRAGIPHPQCRLYFGTRVLLYALKEP